MQGKELQRARRWVALGTKRKEGALQIQTVGEYKYRVIQETVFYNLTLTDLKN